jgi:sterol desaturase/sphingolipid hydroxylase (fatty acid hydroxylase superfamily)
VSQAFTGSCFARSRLWHEKTGNDTEATMTLFGLSEPVIRVLAFSTIFIALAAVELLAPRLERDEMRGALKSRRWMTNLAMVVLSSVALQGRISRWPRSAPRSGRNPMVSAFVRFSVYRCGLAGILVFILLDFAVWLEHVVSHKWPWLWRIHRMHHADTGFDLTTALQVPSAWKSCCRCCGRRLSSSPRRAGR